MCSQRNISGSNERALRGLLQIRGAMEQRDARYTPGGLLTEADDLCFGRRDRGVGCGGRGTTQVPVPAAITRGCAEGEYPELLRMLPPGRLGGAPAEEAVKKIIEPVSQLKADVLSAYKGRGDAWQQPRADSDGGSFVAGSLRVSALGHFPGQDLHRRCLSRSCQKPGRGSGRILTPFLSAALGGFLPGGPPAEDAASAHPVVRAFCVGIIGGGAAGRPLGHTPAVALGRHLPFADPHCPPWWELKTSR